MEYEVMSLIGDWSDVEKMQNQFGERSIREKLGKLITAAKLEDGEAYEQIKLLYSSAASLIPRCLQRGI